MNERSEGPDEALRKVILDVIEAAGPGKTVAPVDAAKAARPDDWRSILKQVNRLARKMATEGVIAIYRKGKVVDPRTAKGVIRLGLPQAPHRTDRDRP